MDSELERTWKDNIYCKSFLVCVPLPELRTLVSSKTTRRVHEEIARMTKYLRVISKI